MATPPGLRSNKQMPTIKHIKRQKRHAPIGTQSLPASTHAKMAKKEIWYNKQNSGIDPARNADDFDL